MKKTFRFLSMATILVVSAIMTGCSSDDNIDNPQQPANKDNVVTLTATVSLDGAAGTRAINPTSGVKTFESTNKIAVFYEDGDEKIQKAESGALTLSADKKKATFTVTLSNPKSGGDFRYVYPSTMAKDLDATPPAYPAYVDASLEDLTIDYSGILGSQDGTLETIGTKYDLAVYDGSLVVTELPEGAPMGNPLAICKFSLTDGTSPITSSVNKLTVSDGTNTYAVTPSSSLTAIYVAMKPVADKKIAFTARTTDSKTYFKTTGAERTLNDGYLYTNITVGMKKLAVGNVIGYDGDIYASKTAAGSQAAAVIVYLGSNTDNETFKNGLAIALADEGSMKWSPAKSTCEGKTAITGAKWCLPSQDQWKQMFKANGDNDASYTGLNTTITTAGGTTLQEGVSYWSSSESNPVDDAYYGVNLNGSNASASWSNDYEGSLNRVRACLAF